MPESPLCNKEMTGYIQRFFSHDPLRMRDSSLGGEELRNDSRNNG